MLVWFASVTPKMLGHNVALLAKALAKPREEIEQKFREAEREETNRHEGVQGIVRSIPLLKTRNDGLLDQHIRSIQDGYYVETIRPENADKEHFAVVVGGYKMFPPFLPGELAVCFELDPLTAQIENGRPYVFQTNEDTYFLRLTQSPKDPTKLIATPSNPKSKPKYMQCDRTQISRLGYVVTVHNFMFRIASYGAIANPEAMD